MKILDTKENERFMRKLAGLNDFCGVCGKPITNQKTVQDAECGTCCAAHYDCLAPYPKKRS